MKHFFNPTIWVLVFSALFLNSCVGSKARLLELVPADSNLVVIINWATVRKDDGLKRIVRADIYEAQIQRFGIAVEKVSEIVVFGVMGANGTQGSLLFRGTFDERIVLSKLKSQGWSETQIDGRMAYLNGKDYIASPSESVLAAGTLEGIEAVFRASKNHSKSLANSPSFKKIKNSLSESKSPITAMLIAPDGTLEAVDAALSVTGKVLSFFDMGEIGTILKTLNIASGAGYTIARGKNEKFAVSLSVLMRDEQTAKVAVGSLNILKNISGAVADKKDRETTENLQDFKFTREENVLLIKMQIPEKEFLPNNY